MLVRRKGNRNCKNQYNRGMFIDVTLKITPKLLESATNHEQKAFRGHLGTHFDVMNQTFSLDYIERVGVIFDVSGVHDRDIEISDIDLDKIPQDSFVLFYTGFIEEVGYGNATYFHKHPQLSKELIETLIQKKISLIGIDFAGVRRGKEHTPTDQYCADHQVFIIENLTNLKELLNHDEIIVHTYPLNYEGWTGLPSRVIAEIKE